MAPAWRMVTSIVGFRWLGHTVGEVVLFRLVIVFFDAFIISADLLASTQIALLQVDSHILSFLKTQRRFDTPGVEYISALAILAGVALIQTCGPLEQTISTIIEGAIVIIQHLSARSDGPAFTSLRAVHHRRKLHGDTLPCDVLVVPRRLNS